MRRHPVPDLDTLGWSALDGGRFVVFGVRQRDDRYEAVLLWCDDEGQHEEALDYVPVDAWSEHSATVLAHGSGCVVLAEPSRAFWYPEPGVREEIPLVGAEELAAVSPTPRLAGRCAVSDTAEWSVVLEHGVLSGEARYAGLLEVDVTAREGRWRELWRLAPSDFPADRFGIDTADNRPDEISLTSTLHRDGVRYAVSEGSDLGSVLRYGADFFACGVVDPAGRLTRLIHQQDGWKRQSGKHGVRGRFTADGRCALLTPVFGSGEWKGRQRVLTLADGTLSTPKYPRGMTQATLLDGRDGRWWLRLADEIVGPVEVELV